MAGCRVHCRVESGRGHAARVTGRHSHSTRRMVGCPAIADFEFSMSKSDAAGARKGLSGGQNPLAASVAASF